MTTPTAQSNTSTNYQYGVPAYNSSFESDWVLLVEESHTADTKAGTYWNPGSDLATTRRFLKPAGCSTLVLSYIFEDVAGLTVTGPNVIVFGRYTGDQGANGGPWMLLSNRDEQDGIATAITLPSSFANWATDGEHRFGPIDPGIQWFDTMGCNEFVVAVASASSASPDGGSTEVDQHIIGKFL